MRTKRIAVALFASLALFLSLPAAADEDDDDHGGGTCGVSGSTVTSVGQYNPFAPAGISAVPVNLTLTRFIADHGKKTQLVDFYLVQPAGSNPGRQIVYMGSNVLYTLPATHPLSLPSPPASGTIYYNFGGVSQPDSVNIPLTVTIPPGDVLFSGQDLVFDIVYICTGTGGMHDVDSPQTLPHVITIKIDVISALQASYAGPALDFGEIGAVTDAQAPSHSVSGQFNVQSSGPYLVELSSTGYGSGGAYLMTYPGGNSTVPGTGNVKYSLDFLGRTRDYADHSPISKHCAVAGIGTPHTLQITATLQEGGQGKTPSPLYQDLLSVTFTPLVFGFPGTCN